MHKEFLIVILGYFQNGGSKTLSLDKYLEYFKNG